ncbi:TlpA family protein disulfide reductase [Candidatus Bandiella numerosa]|jgi:thiol-disulfide isomerase/thioredoxin|uniref:TlpA family protein disulfide reductase n=1 Tax=Candidatus Bandiella numerosa TaxID=2570586 RepID=UPI00249F83F4|nr:TlpA disulfide reductase family protein [Candidatus Bandiella numerosa]WHA05399.1 TlpA family protein disulfide reductase [Candidatus Bandiella numerosa]
MSKLALFISILFFSISILSANVLSPDNNKINIKKILEKYNLAIPKQIDDSKFFNDKAKPVYLKEFNNKFIILNFWANWCVECVNELKSLSNLQKEFDKLKIIDVEIISVNDNSLDFEKVQNFYQNNKVNNLKVYFDLSKNLMTEFKVNSPPTTIFIDKGGKVFAKFNNTYNWSEPLMLNYILDIKDNNH